MNSGQLSWLLIGVCSTQWRQKRDLQPRDRPCKKKGWDHDLTRLGLEPCESGWCHSGEETGCGGGKSRKKNLGWVLASSHINLILLGIWNHVTETLVDPCQANLWSWSSGWWMIIAHQSRNSGSSEREGQ